MGAGSGDALEGSSVQYGRNVDTVGVFEPMAAGRNLTPTADGDGFVAAETGTTWSVTGSA